MTGDAFILSLLFIFGVRSQQLFAKSRADLALELFNISHAYVRSTEEVHAQVDALKHLLVAVKPLIETFGDDLLNDRFYAPASRLIAAIDEVSANSTNPIHNALNKQFVLLAIPHSSIKLEKCLANKMQSSFTPILLSASQRIGKLKEDEASLKAEVVSSCGMAAVLRAGKVKECVASVLNRQPLPATNNSGVFTVQALSTMYSCMQEISAFFQSVGEAGIMTSRTLAPDSLKYLFPENFAVPYQQDLKFPSDFTLSAEVLQRLSSTTDKLQSAKEVFNKAKKLKQMTQAAAIESLVPFVKNASAFTRESEKLTSAEEQTCYSETKAALHNAPKKFAASLVKCISFTNELPQNEDFTSLEKSLKAREMTEKTFVPAINCAAQSINAFDVDLMNKCFKLAEDEALLFLYITDLSTTVLYKDALNTLTQAERCVRQAQTELCRSLREELYSLGNCIAKTSRVRLTLPPHECVAVS